MNKTAEERITQSRVRLLLTKPFFGQLAVRLKIVDATNWLPTAATDGRRFMFNRDFVDNLTDEMLDFLVGHEVLHCVFDHMQARGDRKPQLYNAAADYNINMTLVEHHVGEPIKDDKLQGGKICLDWKYRGLNSYEIYDKLIEDNKGQEGGMDVHMEVGDSDDDADGQGGAGGFDELPKARITDQKKLIPFNYRNDDIQDQTWYDNGVITFSKTGVGFDHPKLDMLIIASDVEEGIEQFYKWYLEND